MFDNTTKDGQGELFTPPIHPLPLTREIPLLALGLTVLELTSINGQLSVSKSEDLGQESLSTPFRRGLVFSKPLFVIGPLL